MTVLSLMVIAAFSEYSPAAVISANVLDVSAGVTGAAMGPIQLRSVLVEPETVTGRARLFAVAHMLLPFNGSNGLTV